MRLFQFPAGKKITCALLAAMMVAACGGGGGGGAKSTSNATQPDPVPAPPAGNVNSPPTIQGQPGGTVLVGQAYGFQPVVNDPDGDTLAFSASNLPDWASFAESTGRISGTPDNADIGTYSGITIRVSDGTAGTTFGPFAITVSDVASGSATLSWTPPTENSDGSTLTNLAGYEVRYGRSADDLSQNVSLTNPSLSSYMVENLTQGIWYFAVVSVNSLGVASPLSNLASKTIG